MRIRSLFILMSFVLFLAACSSATPATTSESVQPTPSIPASGPSITEPPASSAGEATHTDNQGVVEVSVTPVNLSNLGETLNFVVALNTHSVDLSMDLAALATLNTDTGKSVQAAVWEAPRGGHHVEGTLSFPVSVDGQSILEGAKTLTLTIKDLDAPERTFMWDLTE